MATISNVIFMGKYDLKLEKTNASQILELQTILILSTIFSVLEISTRICSANKGVKSFVPFPSPCHPLNPTPLIKILFLAPSLWPEYYSLLRDCDSESACLSPDRVGAAEQLWKQWRSWGKLWLVGRAGEIWDPPGPVPMSAHSLRNVGVTWASLLPSWGSPLLAQL